MKRHKTSFCFFHSSLNTLLRCTLLSFRTLRWCNLCCLSLLFLSYCAHDSVSTRRRHHDSAMSGTQNGVRWWKVSCGTFLRSYCVSVLAGWDGKQTGWSRRLGRVKGHCGQRGGDGGEQGAPCLTWSAAQKTSSPLSRRRKWGRQSCRRRWVFATNALNKSACVTL